MPAPGPGLENRAATILGLKSDEITTIEETGQSGKVVEEPRQGRKA